MVGFKMSVPAIAFAAIALLCHYVTSNTTTAPSPKPLRRDQSDERGKGLTSEDDAGISEEVSRSAFIYKALNEMTHKNGSIDSELMQVLLCNDLQGRATECETVMPVREYVWKKYGKPTGRRVLRKRRFADWNWGLSYDPWQSNRRVQTNPWLSGYNQQSSSYNQHPSGYNQHPSGYNQQSSGYNQQSSGYDQLPLRQYVNKGQNSDPYKSNQNPYHNQGPAKKTSYQAPSDNSYDDEYKPWKPVQEKANALCPGQANQSLVYNFNPNMANFPAISIGTDLGTLADNFPGFRNCLDNDLILPGTQPVVTEGVFSNTNNRTCPSRNFRLWEYSSQLFSARCWVLPNFNPPVYFTVCSTARCQNCKDNQRSGGYSVSHKWPREFTAKICANDFRVQRVLAYCPTRGSDADPRPRFVRDLIIISTCCTCNTVQCDANH